MKSSNQHLTPRFQPLADAVPVSQGCNLLSGQVHSFNILDRVVYRLLNYGQQYIDKGIEHDEARSRQQKLQWLPKQAREFKLQLVSNQPVPSVVS